MTLTTALSYAAMLHAELEGATPVEHKRERSVRVDTPRAYRLANGLSVVLRRDPTRSDVEVSMRYAVGSADDPPGYAGLAHLVEHLTFRGSRHLSPLEAYSALEKVGASSINGRTGLTETVYGCVVPSNQLETALWVESDRMAFTLEKLNETHLELERRIVSNEIRQHNRGVFITQILEAIFPEGHPYHPQEGRLSDLEAIRLRDVQWFFQRWYRPDNARLVLSGDLDLDGAMRLVEKYFGPVVAPRAPLPRRRVPAVALPAVRRLRVAAPVTPEHMMFVWLGPHAASQDAVALEVAGFALEQRLKRELSAVEHGVTRTRVFSRDVGTIRFILVDLELSGRADPERVDLVMTASLRRLLRDSLAPEEVREARAWLASSVVFGSENVDGERPASRAETLRRVMRTDVSDISVVVRKYLSLGHRLVAVLETSRYASPRGETVDMEDSPR